jgi:hypothetical protein
MHLVEILHIFGGYRWGFKPVALASQYLSSSLQARVENFRTFQHPLAHFDTSQVIALLKDSIVSFERKRNAVSQVGR